LKTIGNIEIKGLKKIKTGKVREVFETGEDLLIVTTDRISAFDYVLPTLIPYKGILLNQISLFWFNYLNKQVDNHIVQSDFDKFPEELKNYEEILRGRAVIVKKLDILPVECIVRGYITGSAWNEYLETGKVGDEVLPSGLEMCAKFPEPIFTPTTKESEGHDMPLSFKEASGRFGKEVMELIKKKSIDIYKSAAHHASDKGIIIADTKFEFGFLNGNIILADEVLTPDSSRFWFKNDYKVGKSQKSFDKQFLRDYLLSSSWDRNSVPPELPEEIILKTTERYITSYENIVGKKFQINH
jgi:phosphoribosylaminoimidazole-succinocarboxamide synthase